MRNMFFGAKGGLGWAGVGWGERPPHSRYLTQEVFAFLVNFGTMVATQINKWCFTLWPWHLQGKRRIKETQIFHNAKIITF
jgi:hypothetical protein